MKSPLLRTLAFKFAVALFVIAFLLTVNGKDEGVAAGCVVGGAVALVAAAIEARGSGLHL